jgi:uncharacterized protein YecT (DUF1311 family)
MLPPSWKSEVQKALEESVNADREKRQTQQDDAATKIAAALETISNAQDRQTSHQDSSSKKNLALNVVTITLVFLTVIFTYKSWRTFDAQLGEMQRAYGPIKDQAEATKAALIAGQRAWIRIDSIDVAGGGLSISEAGSNVAIAFVMTNIGNSPAIRLSHHVKLIALAAGMSIPDEQAKVCDEAKRVWQGGFTLFPNDTFPRNLGIGGYAIGISMPKEAVARGLEFSAEKKYLSFMVVGCIDYTFGTDPETHHQTPFIRQLRKRNIAEGPISIDDKMILAAALQLDDFGIGIGRAAD